MHSPAALNHLIVTKNALKLLDCFVVQYNLGQVFCEKALIGLTRNDYEPDICFSSNEKAEKFVETTAKFPAPDFTSKFSPRALSTATAALNSATSLAMVFLNTG